jgi:uncharacterized protein (TIGR03435 family)
MRQFTGLVAIPLLARGMAQQTAPPTFEVATIKPAAPNQPGYGINYGRGTIKLNNVTPRQAILCAYDLHDYQLSGGPKWVTSEAFDITAKADPSDAKRDDLFPMLRTLLADRFQLVLRKEIKPLPAYALIMAKGGLKLQKAAPGGPRGTSSGSRKLTAHVASMSVIAGLIASKVERPVVDRTGAEGVFNFDLHFASDNEPPDSTEPSFFTALQEQCGLKLETTTAPGDTFVIERAERPSAN